MKSDWRTSGVPFYRTREIVRLKNIGSANNELFISEEMYSEYARKYGVPTAGDLMVTGIGTLGVVYVVQPEDCFYFKDASILWLQKKHEIDSRFVAYAFESDQLQSQISDSPGATVGSYTVGKAQATRIPVPSLPEQRRIVAILDEAFEGIATAKANAEKNLRNANEVLESRLQSLLSPDQAGCNHYTLDEIASVFGRGKSRHRPRNEPTLYGGPYPFIQTGDIRNADHVVTTFTQTYSDKGLAQSKLWPRGTVCITIAANIAESAILGFDACFPDSVVGVIPIPQKASAEFLEFLLQAFKRRLQAMGKGSAQDNINVGTFENQRFPFPSVEEQRKEVAILTSVLSYSRLVADCVNKKIEALDELKASLLHQAFTGQL